MKIKIQQRNVLKILIYVCIMICFIIKMNYYSDHFGYFNDELAHVSYIAHLESTEDLFPEFKEMHLLEGCDLNGEESVCSYNDTLNWLGHPPLYYHVMRLMGGVTCEGDVIHVDMIKLRHNTQLLACIGLCLAFYLGFRKIKSVAATLLYAVVLVSVPMFSFISAAINNDTMSYICGLIYLIGVFRFCEKKRNILTYLLIGIGITMAGLTKVTTLVVIAVSALLIVGYTIYKEKSLECIYNKSFLISAVVYIPVIIYYVLMLINYKSVQFTATDYGYPAVFVPEEQRTIHGLFQYGIKYIERYLLTWCNISGHYTVVKSQNIISTENIMLLVLFASPFILLFVDKTNKYKLANRTLTIGYIVAMLINFKVCYSAYQVRGYFGGMHSRYYYFLIPMIALWNCTFYENNVELWIDKLDKHVSAEKLRLLFTIAVFFISSLFIYGDFLAFLRVNTLYI